ncbi:MAG: ECF transporter S component [Candidatus Limivicinus sp.]|jgi:uncharacterized membrane protein
MKKSVNVRRLTGMAFFTAIVVILQFVGSCIHFGPFSVSLVLVPIVVGAALYGVGAGAWLGFIFSLTVIFSGDAALFMPINPLGTVATVILKGTLAGLCAGLAFKAFGRKNEYVGVMTSAVVCPIVNTGVFLLGCLVFFMDTIRGWAEAAGFANVGTYMIVGFVGFNFLFELLVNVVLGPVIMRLINLGKGRRAK